MKKVSILVLFLTLSTILTAAGIKESIRSFTIGAAINSAQIRGADTLGVAVIKDNFNSIVAENCMKSEVLQPQKGHYVFDLADKFVQFGVDNDMEIIGHTLIWHEQLPKWFTLNDDGTTVGRDELIARMKGHITTVVNRYKGKVKGWDVVNEAILDDGSWRKTPFYDIIGEDYIRLAFEFAHRADPDAELYYNDFSTALPKKREAIVRLVKRLKEQGVRIDAVGMQGHINLEFPKSSEFEKSIVAFASQGVKVMITEFDISTLPSVNFGANVSDRFKYTDALDPYRDGLTPSIQSAWDEKVAEFFALFFKHSNKISRVTVWGVADSDSWKNNWPIVGRTDYPLLFDRNYKPKPIVEWIIQNAK